MYSIKMSKKTLKFEVEVNKKEIHVSKKPIALSLLNVNQILKSDKFGHSDKGFKYFIGYKDYNIIRSLCIILPQMSGFIKYFGNGGKNLSLMIQDDSVLVKYNEIWNKIEKKLNIKFHNMLVYDDKWLKTKIKQFNGVVDTIFGGDKVSKEGVHDTCTACISIDSVLITYWWK